MIWHSTSTLMEPHQEQSQDHCQMEWLGGEERYNQTKQFDPLTHVEQAIHKRARLVSEKISQDTGSNCSKCRFAWKCEWVSTKI